MLRRCVRCAGSWVWGGLWALAGAVVGLSAAPAMARQEDPRGLAASQVPVAIEQLGVLRAVKGGVPGVPTFGERGCTPVTSSHTNANFSGGQFVVQAGMGEGESFAATYTIPASAWPIKIDLAEAIMATSNATVQTTTVWGVRFWQGLPGTGSLVFSVDANDIDLPYARIGPGTAGVNIQFSVDPNDPEQIILQNNGSSQFTIEWEIVDHNNQTANPCTTAPPSSSNAFWTTDVGGLQQPTLNWLFGLNCGALGCPPNGGWARFSALNVLCRPTGDVVTRVTWSSVNCQPALGACCLPNGSCLTTSQADCTNQGGFYNGDNTNCQTTNCLGACCLPGGNCIVTSPADCAAQSGTFRGRGTECATANCPIPTGACCLNNGTFCLVLTQVNCAGAGGVYQGDNIACGAGNACPSGACCLPSGACELRSPAGCAAANGIYRGNGTSCATANCPQPRGACCFANNFCLPDLLASECTGAGGSWLGGLTTCQTPGCGPTGPVCDDIDFNNDGIEQDPTDIEAFLSVYSGGLCVPPANTCGDIDFNNDGIEQDPTDIEAFLSVYSGGPCL